MNEAHCVPHPSNDSATARSGQVDATFRRDVLTGLGQLHKQLPCKYFYDLRGSQLFDQICDLDEYYLTRTETQIMSDSAKEIAQHFPRDSVLVEYGSGSSTKTRLLLQELRDLRAYLPVDISEAHLLQTAKQLDADYPQLHVQPIVADFTAPFDLPAAYRDAPTMVYFPGSTLGNLEPQSASRLLRQIAQQCQPNGKLLIGLDLDKDPTVLQAAYDDAKGVTAAFNLNLLQRINKELDADFDVEQYRHRAIYKRAQARVEIYIESLRDQTVNISGTRFSFRRGEYILTEYSHKYGIESFRSMAGEAGWKVDAVWTDAKQFFAVMLMTLATNDK